MRGRVTGFVVVTATLVWVGVAGAARVNVLEQERVLRSAGPTLWEAIQVNSDYACAGSSSDPFYSPVLDGTALAGNASRGDAFDGGMVFLVNGVDYYDTDGVVRAKGESVTTDTRNTGGLAVKRTDTALRSGPILRSLVRLRNPGDSPFSGAVTLDSELGTDLSGSTQATASGDATFSPADRWIVTSTPPPLTPDDDPAVTHALFGKGAALKSGQIAYGPAAGCVTVDFNLSLGPGKTRYLLFFAELNPSPGRAERSARKYNQRRLSRSLLKGVGKRVKRKVVNWDLQP